MSATKPHFTSNEARTIYLIEEMRDRPSTPRRRRSIRYRKVKVVWYRGRIRAAAALTGWDHGQDRKARYHGLIDVYNADTIGTTWKRLYEDPGQRALDAARRHVGKRETGYNDAPWLRQMEDDLPHDRLDWMIPGQPYCGLGDIWAYWAGPGLLLPDGTVYTPNIAGYDGMTFTDREGRKWKLERCRPEDAKPGALVVFNFGSGGAKHTGLARGAMRRGQIKTREYNTSPGSGGSQANGDGCWNRTRPLGFVLSTLNVVKA